MYDYISYQNILDEMRINKKLPVLSDAYNGDSRTAYSEGFTCESTARFIISELSEKEFAFDKTPYLITAKVIRAFVLYNMAMEWGSIPIVPNDFQTGKYELSNANDVYDFCLKELLTEKIPEQKDKESNCFSQKAADVLKAEIYMALGNKEEAKKILNTIPSEDIFELTNENGDKIEIYSAEYVKYLKEEANGKDNSAEWFTNRKAKYGTFAALHRLDKLQSLVGIDSKYNFLPRPTY